ncbi:MAG: CPBP family intramembrane metalloprotease [Candidatus Thermoplasmatota archaeon]|nr:CPBP family intramembrane metalloprotease [Candidatus Thermoplasmatota archaeon]MCL5790270.1 CPBP family intramembrane metalloprotease [Candidatus Thermoplasmatota archaeon]
MNKGYVAFVAVLGILWVVTMIVDIVMTLSIYPSKFGAIASLTEGPTANPAFPIYVIIGLPEAVGLFYPPYLFWAVWIGVVTAAVIVFLIISLYGSVQEYANSSLYKISEFFALNLFLSYVYIVVVAYLGHPITSPFTSGTGHFLSYFFSVTNAGLYEELISRVTYVGIPLFIYYSWSVHGKRSPSRPNKLPWWRIIWGGGYRFGKPEIVVLVISSLIFGIAHAGSWSISKIPQAALGGVFLGVLYMRFGLYADVLFHFSVDSPGVVMTNVYGSPLATAGTTDLYSVFILVFLVAGAVVTVMYIAKLVNLINRRKAVGAEATPAASSATGSGYGQLNSNGPSKCPRCGSLDSNLLYDDIHRCNSCGTVYKKS